MRSIQALSVVALLLLALGCTTRVPATVTMRPTHAIEKNAIVFVQANRLGGVVADSLTRAGIKTTTVFAEATYILDVKVGASRGGGGVCGPTSNVVYILNGEGRRLLVIKGRGPTGECDSSVFDDISRMLATYSG